MSYFLHWRRAKSAETQDLESSYQVVAAHGCTKGIRVGSFAGAVTGVALFPSRLLFRSPTPIAALFTHFTLLTTGAGGMNAFFACHVFYTYGYYTWKDREWKERSWKLLGDKRQLEREDWTYTTMALCGAWTVTQPTPEPMFTVWKEKMPALAQKFLSPKVFSGLGEWELEVY